MFSEKVIDRFVNTKNVGLIKNASATASVTHSLYGDVFKAYLRIENNKIVEAKFKAFGSAALIACGDIAMDYIIDKSINDIKNLTATDILCEVGDLPEEKAYCTKLIQETLLECIKVYEKKIQKENKN